MMVVNVRHARVMATGPIRTPRPAMKMATNTDTDMGAQRQRWQCSICNKLLSSKRSYDEHLNIHNRSRPFVCEHCDYSAASQMTLRRHTLRNHTPRDEWGYKCPYCAEAYMEPASYQQHVSSRHFGRSATFGCPYSSCQFVSKCSRHFREHLVKHHNVSSRRSCSTQFSLPDDECLQEYIVDDDLGVGFGKRVITRPLARGTEFVSIKGAVPQRVVIQPSTSMGFAAPLPPHSVSPAQSSTIIYAVPKQRVFIRTAVPVQAVAVKEEPPELTPEGRIASIVADQDFLKTPISIHRPPLTRVPPPIPRRGASTARRQSNHPRPYPYPHQSRRPPKQVKEEEVVRELGLVEGAMEAPAEFKVDVIDCFEHEEEVIQQKVYPDGSVDWECD